jgi:hypothetical protein
MGIRTAREYKSAEFEFTIKESRGSETSLAAIKHNGSIMGGSGVGAVKLQSVHAKQVSQQRLWETIY